MCFETDRNGEPTSTKGRVEAGGVISISSPFNGNPVRGQNRGSPSKTGQTQQDRMRHDAGDT